VKILFICGGNTCRSPMAKTILKQILKQRGLEGKVFVDSVAGGTPSGPKATREAREVIKQLYGVDLLVDHKSKSVSIVSVDDFDLILTMEERQKLGLPKNKTYTLKEYARIRGDIDDPFGMSFEEYRRCCNEIKECLYKVVERVLGPSS